MKWHATSQTDAQNTLAKAIGCRHSGEGLRIAAISECLRAASSLCSAPLDGGTVWEPAASLSLTSMVRRRLSPIWPDLAEDDHVRHGVMGVLDSLGGLGDLVRVEGNKWLTSPALAVRAADGTAVVVGGGPAQSFPDQVRLISTGRVRLVHASSCEGWADVWEAEDWIGAPLEGLAAWSARLLSEVRTRLVWAPTNLNELSIYLTRKWVPLEMISGAEGLLITRCRIGPIWSYFMGEFSRGHLSRLASITLEEARRYRFYVDHIAGCSISLVIETAPGLAKIRLPRPLPKEEAKALMLGWQIPSAPNAHPGSKTYVLPIETLPIVRCALEGLGVLFR